MKPFVLSFRMSLFPEMFAILRRHSTRGPFWQILRGSISNQLYQIEADETYSSADTYLQEYSRPFVVHEARFRLDSGTQSLIKFWYLPIMLIAFEQEVPVLDFEYKSWLPRPHNKIPVTNIQEVSLRYKTAYNKFQNYTHSLTISDFSSLPLRPPTPPRQRIAQDSDDDSVSNASTESVLTIYQNESAFLVQHHDEFQYKEKPLRLPETVGSLLLEKAWNGDECCPISAVPFKEIDSLSVTSCFHIFDTKSLRLWQVTKNECPVCRCSITNVVTQEKN